MDFSLGQDPRVHPAPARVKLLGDSHELAVGERPLDGLARLREGGDFEENPVANPQADPGNDEVPFQPFDGDVFTCGPDVDRMTLLLQRIDPFQRIHAHCALGSAMVFRVVLFITNETKRRHLCAINALLRYAAVGDVNRCDAPSSGVI